MHYYLRITQTPKAITTNGRIFTTIYSNAADNHELKMSNVKNDLKSLGDHHHRPGAYQYMHGYHIFISIFFLTSSSLRFWQR